MNILIIGGTGFLGSYLQSSLSIKYTIDYTYSTTKNTDGIQYKVGENKLIDIAKKKYDVVINNINQLHLSYAQTLFAVEELISFCKYWNSHLIHISSVSALYENRFSNDYNLKKAITEDFIRTELSNNQYSIVRFTQLFDAKGLSRTSQAGLYYLLKEIKLNNPIKLFANKDICFRNYMPVELAVNAIDLIIEQQIIGIFNTHFDSFTLSFNELIDSLSKLNKMYNSNLITTGDKIGLPYFIPQQSDELMLKIKASNTLIDYFTEAYKLV